MGRISKLTDELQAALCTYIEAGNTYKGAYMACGICERTFFGWMEKGRESKNGKYQQFFQAVKKAEGKAYTSYVDALHKGASAKNMTAVIFWLQNRHSEEWQDKRQVNTHITGKLSMVDFLGEFSANQNHNQGTVHKVH